MKVVFLVAINLKKFWFMGDDLLLRDFFVEETKTPKLTLPSSLISWQAIGSDSWENGEPQQEEEDLWDSARLQVCHSPHFSEEWSNCANGLCKTPKKSTGITLEITFLHYMCSIFTKEGWLCSECFFFQRGCHFEDLFCYFALTVWSYCYCEYWIEKCYTGIEV